MDLELCRPNAAALVAASDDIPFVPYVGSYCALKRGVELAAASLLLLLLSPVMLLAAAAVKLTSRGPVFYRQKRLGRNGVPFDVWKFRTMIDNAEQKTGPVWSCPDDPRITPLGRILRDTHVDEFPQLFNVIAGSMSLVGPRPERPEIIADLQKKIPFYALRMHVRPGITGFAQIRLPADSDLAGVRRKLAYDLYYIEHLSAWLDAKIMLVTALDFCGSILSVVTGLLPLPAAHDVEKRLPLLMDEESARETFRIDAARVLDVEPSPADAVLPAARNGQRDVPPVSG